MGGGNKPFRYAGYEIERRLMKEVEQQIRLYPIRKARLAFLKAKWADRDMPDYHTYRSPTVDAMPGAPEGVGDPTGSLAAEIDAARAENQNIAYLEAWVAAMDVVLHTRLDHIQRMLIERYVMVPAPMKTLDTLTDLAVEASSSRSQAYHWINLALIEFAFLLLDEGHIRKLTGKNPE